MKKKGIDVCAIGLMLCVVLGISGTGWASPLSAGDMYLNPGLIPPQNYLYNYYSAGYSANFLNVQSLQVLPALQPDGSTYYFTPTVDYTGDITGSNGSISFIRPGPYFVLATFLDNSSQLFDFGIEFEIHTSHTTGPTYKWKKTETPAPDVVVTDPALAGSNPDFPGGTTEVNDKADWAAVTAYLLTLNNKHVELGGHGGPGRFYYNGVLVLDDNTAATQAWLTSMQGHVNNLTFMSCSTGAGTAGADFLQGVANALGASAGYTDVVGGNGTDWFINDDGTKVVFAAIPEPATFALFIGGFTVLMTRRRAA